jgi:hypothetical protein
MTVHRQNPGVGNLKAKSLVYSRKHPIVSKRALPSSPLKNPPNPC